MDIKILFAPISEKLATQQFPTYSFANSISFYADLMPDYKTADIAILGIDIGENQLPADIIRQKLYGLSKGTGIYSIVDLGNLNRGIDDNETKLRLQEVCKYLLEQDTLPIIVGGTHDYDYAQYLAYEDMDKLVSFLNIDAFLDMEDGGYPVNNHIQQIFLHDPNYLFNYSHIGYQSYLVNQQSLDVLENLYFDAHSVGKLRENIQEMEPVIRDADMMSFDVVGIRSGDASGTSNPQPFGLSGEEACQLSWYAGLSEKLSSVGYYGYIPEYDDINQKTATIVATMIWYFVEGYYHRKNEQHYTSNDYIKYVVSMADERTTLTFYKSKLSEKWWLEVPYHKGNERYARNSIVPCSYQDYQVANKGELPERYITTHAKLI